MSYAPINITAQFIKIINFYFGNFLTQITSVQSSQYQIQLASWLVNLILISDLIKRGTSQQWLSITLINPTIFFLRCPRKFTWCEKKSSNFLRAHCCRHFQFSKAADEVAIGCWVGYGFGRIKSDQFDLL
jgi:hypothetical protein